MILPKLIDLTPEGHVTKKAKIGEEGYGENIECSLQLNWTKDGIEISYYREDDEFLDKEQVGNVIDYSIKGIL